MTDRTVFAMALFAVLMTGMALGALARGQFVTHFDKLCVWSGGSFSEKGE